MASYKFPKVAITSAYELGKKDAYSYKKFNSKPSRWIRFLSTMSNSGLRKKHEDSYKIGYFEVINQRNERERREQAKERAKSQKKPKQKKTIKSNNIEELPKDNAAIIAKYARYRRGGDKSKGRDFDMER